MEIRVNQGWKEGYIGGSITEILSSLPQFIFHLDLLQQKITNAGFCKLIQAVEAYPGAMEQNKYSTDQMGSTGLLCRMQHML